VKNKYDIYVESEKYIDINIESKKSLHGLAKINCLKICQYVKYQENSRIF
jgi:hypothetical protein